MDKEQRKLIKEGEFTMHELWTIESLLIEAIINAEDNMEKYQKKLDGKFKASVIETVTRNTIKEYKLMIKKCYWQQGIDCPSDEEIDELIKGTREFNNRQGGW